MTDADVGKPLLVARVPSPHDFTPQSIDWRKVAGSLRDTGERAAQELNFAPLHEKPAIATVMATCNCLAAAIEEGLS